MIWEEGPEGPGDYDSRESFVAAQTIESQLFESLVHHLIEKGIFTRNDALSVVQTVAEVKHGELEGGRPRTAFAKNELAFLKRLYSSFELVSDRALHSKASDSGNVRHLRPPLHGDRPKFPRDD